jgi:purine-nucleoside phosphorylase
MNEKIKQEIEEIISALANLDVDLEHQGLYVESALVEMQIMKLRRVSNHVS